MGAGSEPPDSVPGRAVGRVDEESRLQPGW